MITLEHDPAVEILREVRAANSDHVLEPNACTSFVTLHDALWAFEKAMHHQMHLEKNILFPRALDPKDSAEKSGRMEYLCSTSDSG